MKVYDETGDLRSVVDRIVAETAEGVRPDIASHYATRTPTGPRYRAIKLGEDSSRQTQGAS